MRYRLRTLLIAMAFVPPLLATAWLVRYPREPKDKSRFSDLHTTIDDGPIAKFTGHVTVTRYWWSAEPKVTVTVDGMEVGAALVQPDGSFSIDLPAKRVYGKNKVVSVTDANGTYSISPMSAWIGPIPKWAQEH